MSIILRGLPVLVEAGEDSRPVAFWWQNRRHVVDEVICVWDDNCDTTAHWLVLVQDVHPVSLIYDRSASQWLMEWTQAESGPISFFR
jgi:hypothetical protein